MMVYQEKIAPPEPLAPTREPADVLLLDRTIESLEQENAWLKEQLSAMVPAPARHGVYVITMMALAPAVPVVNQIRTYWWCSPPRTGRQRMVPASLTARETGASFSKDKCVLISL